MATEPETAKVKKTPEEKAAIAAKKAEREKKLAAMSPEQRAAKEAKRAARKAAKA